jgi:hypothetical protein
MPCTKRLMNHGDKQVLWPWHHNLLRPYHVTVHSTKTHHHVRIHINRIDFVLFVQLFAIGMSVRGFYVNANSFRYCTVVLCTHSICTQTPGEYRTKYKLKYTDEGRRTVKSFGLTSKTLIGYNGLKTLKFSAHHKCYSSIGTWLAHLNWKIVCRRDSVTSCACMCFWKKKCKAKFVFHSTYNPKHYKFEQIF